MSLLHNGTQRKHKDGSSDVPSNTVLVGIRCKTFGENYGCGCVWAVPDCIFAEVHPRIFCCPQIFVRPALALLRAFSRSLWVGELQNTTPERASTEGARVGSLRGFLI